MLVGHRSVRLIDRRVVHRYMYIHQRVATDICAVMTRLVVGLAVIGHAAAFAEHEGRIFLCHFPYGQIQNIIGVTAGRLLHHFCIAVRLARRDTVPLEGQLIRTNGERTGNRIDLIIGELQHQNGVATQAVGAVMEVDTRFEDGLSVPDVLFPFVPLYRKKGSIRMDDIQGQHHDAVATGFLMERMTIDTALRQRLVHKSVLVALTHRVLD